MPGAIEKPSDFLNRSFRNLQTDKAHAFIRRRADDFERRILNVFDLPPDRNQRAAQKKNVFVDKRRNFLDFPVPPIFRF